MTSITHYAIGRDKFLLTDNGDDNCNFDEGDFKILGLDAFAKGISLPTESSENKLHFFNGFNLMDKNNNKLSRGEALLGLSVFDEDGIANTTVTSIDKKTVEVYLKTAERKHLNQEEYTNSLKYLFSAVLGNDTQGIKKTTDLINSLIDSSGNFLSTKDIINTIFPCDKKEITQDSLEFNIPNETTTEMLKS